MTHKEILKLTERQKLIREREIIGYTLVNEISHWKMSSKYNIIEHIPIEFKPFGLKYFSIYYINYLKKKKAP